LRITLKNLPLNLPTSREKFMKIISVILVSVFISNIAFSMGSRRPTPPAETPTPTPTESTCNIDDPGKIGYEVNFVPNQFTTEIRMNRVKKLASIANAVVNSPEFKSRVLGSWYKGKAQFADTKDSNEVVYQKIRASSEVFNKCNNYLMELEYQWDSNSGRVLGWTYPTVKTVWFNYKNFDSRSDSGIVGTICHEYLHKLGYGHSSAKSYASVPYAVGTICAELYKTGKY
jgi:hypothetical protein